MDALRDGDIFGTVCTSVFNYGYQAAYWLYQHIVYDLSPTVIKNDAGTILVTMDNVNDYEDLLRQKVDLQ